MTSIALLTYSVKPRGSVVHTACLAEALADAGADVTVYALGKLGDGFFRPLRVPVVLFPAGPAPADQDELIQQRIAELDRGLKSITRRHDVFHAQDCLTASALFATHDTRRRPVVRTVHHLERFPSTYLAECQRRSIQRADLLLSVSARTARETMQRFVRTSTIIHNGVDKSRFELPAVPAPGFEERLGVRPNDVVVLGLGGVEERKNTLRCLEAFIDAWREQPKLRFILVGGASIWDHSSLERRFDARVRGLPAELRARIQRVGSVDEATLTWLHQRSDVLLSPSLHEGWGLAALEGLAARSAVIASRREPFTEFLDDETALLVEPESVADISTALARLAGDSGLRQRLTVAGAKRAGAFTWQKAAREHLEAYRTLTARPRRGDQSPPVAAGDSRSLYHA
jgi:glycosyltransferase-like protein